tara:strand:+ start:49 stop:1254 length:1206 start_codon:yes stop_codon:yes gene_type:complete
MSSNLKVNTILPSTGTTVTVSGISSVTSSISAGSSITGTTFYGSGANLTGIAGGATGLSLNDNVEINLGTDNDLEIFHNNDDAYIRNNSGALILRNNGQSGDADQSQIYIQATPAENSIQCSPNGAVTLFHDNSPRLTTAGGGCNSNKSGQNTFTIGSSNAGGAHIVLDGDSNGDGVGSDYSGISHNTDGSMIIYQDNPNHNGQIDFRTGGANRVSMQSDKFRPSNNEGMTLGTSGLRWGNVYTNGVNFAHTSDASGMSNELLDDYEEGSWTPDLQNTGGSSLPAGYSWRTGKYTKIGNVVNCSFALGLNGGSITSSSQVRLGGLPFAIAGMSYFYYVVLHGYNFASGFGESGTMTMLMLEVNSSVTTQMNIIKGTDKNYVTSGNIGASQRFTGMFQYPAG